MREYSENYKHKKQYNMEDNQEELGLLSTILSVLED
jgi:hypothetical protein